MKYTLATNFDNELVKRLGELGSIESVYGKLREDPIGGGRPSLVLPKISMRTLEDHIKCCHDNGILFNYVLNATCLDNRELTREYHNLFGFVDEIVGLGVDKFTVGNINVLKMLRARHADVGISASIFFNINSIQKMKTFEEMGANEITLYYNFNRDLKLLAKAVQTSEPATTLRIIGNNVCLHECPYRGGHANLLTHASQSTHESKLFFIDTYTITCGVEKLKNPVKFITADWLRPEDIHLYDEIGENKLAVKLTDRARPSEWLYQVAKAYTEEKKEGNLFDIIHFVGNGDYQQLDQEPMIKGALEGKAKVSGLSKLREASSLTPVYVDNQALDGHLEGMQGKDCRNNLCDDKGWFTDGGYAQGQGCSYCRKYAERSVSFDRVKRAKAIAVNEALIKRINTGDMF